MMKLIIETAAFLALCFASARAIEITHRELDGAHMIETGRLNFAVSSPSLARRTVSFNGDNIVIYSPTCQQTLKSVKALSEPEKALIVNLRGQLYPSDGHKRTKTIFSLDGSKVQLKSSIVKGLTLYHDDRLSIAKKDGHNFSLSKEGLPDNLARIFINGDLITFVYLDGQVQMKPVSCLQPAEQQLLQDARSDFQKAEDDFKKEMAHHKNVMGNFKQNMNDEMKKLQDTLRNMFKN